MKLRNLGMMVAALFLVTACGTEGGEETTTVATEPPEATTTTAADTGQEEATTTTEAMEETTTSAAEMMDGVHVAESDLGQILVDPDGFTLYIFTADSEGESACYDACAETWPPVAADTVIGADLDAAMFGAIERTDGTEQLTVNGMPLYLYTPDASPGDTNGHGANDVWFVVDADGNMLEAAASGATEPVASPADDYDY